MEVSRLFLAFVTFLFVEGFPEEYANASRIVLGEKINIKKVPWQVSFHSLQAPNLYAFFCGGAIIGPNEILTAGHCIQDKQIEHILVRAGSSSRVAGGSVHHVEKAEVHPEYKCTTTKMQHDVAFVRVKEPFPFSDTTKPIKLGKSDPRNGQIVHVTGWGKTLPHFVMPQTDLPTYLRFAKLRSWDKKTCYRDIKTEGIDNLEMDMFCLHNYKSGTYEAVCHGDSGSPVVLDKRLVGVISSGMGGKTEGIPVPPPDQPCHLIDPQIANQVLQKFVCNDPKTVGLYNSVVQHRKWIKKLLNKKKFANI